MHYRTPFPLSIAHRSVYPSTPVPLPAVSSWPHVVLSDSLLALLVYSFYYNGTLGVPNLAEVDFLSSPEILRAESVPQVFLILHINTSEKKMHLFSYLPVETGNRLINP